jgi:hypothetical protein
MAINELAEVLLADGPDQCMRVMRLRYPNVMTRRNVIGRVKNRALELLPSYVPSHAPLEAGAEELQRFYAMPRAEQVRAQTAVRKEGDLAKTFSGPVVNIIKAAPLVPSFISHLKLTHEEQEQIRQLSKERIEARSEDVARVDAASLQKFLRRCNTVLRDASADPKELLVALAFVTGRRTAEIMLTGKFERVAIRAKGGSSQHFKACFSGQVKAGLRDTERCYNIPLLAPVEQIITALERLRQRWPLAAGSTAAQVNKHYASTAHRAAKKYLQPLHEKLGHMHAARQLYAMVSFEVCQPHTYSVHGWIRRVLGHSDLDISKSYSNVTIDGSVVRS